MRPARWTGADVALVVGCAVSALLLTLLLMHVLVTSPGWLADLVVWYLLMTGMTYAVTRDQQGVLAARDRIATMVLTTAAVLLLVPLVSLLVYVVGRGLPHLTLGFFTHDLTKVGPDQPAEVGGGLHAIVGTLEQAGVALLMVLPLGVVTAVFLNETRSRMRRWVRIIVDAMSGLPSIVAGLFIYSALIVTRPLGWSVFGFDGFMASLALSLVMLPTVTRTVEVVLRLVPDGLREASLALGASRGRTVFSVVLPTARTGVTTAVVLGLARIVGETAPLLFTAFGTTILNTNPFSGQQESLPLFVFRLVKSPSQNEADRGYVGALVLIVVVLTLFVLARALGRGALRLPRLPRPAAALVRPPPHHRKVARERHRHHRPAGRRRRPRRGRPVRPHRPLRGHPGDRRTAPRGGRHRGRRRLRLVRRPARPRGRRPRHAGERVTALIGPSGCGKSTFLRILNRMHELVPSATLSGEVLLDGEDIYARTMRAQQVRARSAWSSRSRTLSPP